MTEDTNLGGIAAAAATGEDAAAKREDTRSEVRERMEKEENGKFRVYEIGYLIVPTVAESDVPHEVALFKAALEKEKAVVISEEFPKLRALAYPMQKRTGEKYSTHANGYFGWIKFEATPGSALRIDEECKRHRNILRYLLIKTVREHTLTLGRPRFERRERKSIPHGAPASVPISEAELDKSIEKLIAE